MHFILSLALILSLFITSPVLANELQPDNPFEVKDLEVFAEDINLKEATTAALAKGKDDAFKIVLTRILPSTLQWRGEAIELPSNDDFLIDFKITWERMTSKSYRAKVDFIFPTDPLKDLLNAKGIQYTASYQPETLIIQLDSDDKVLSLDDLSSENLMDFDSHYGLSTFKNIIGDIDDQEDLSNITFSSANYSNFTRILSRYRATNVALVKLLTIKGTHVLLIRFIGSDFNKIFYSTNILLDADEAALSAEKIIDDYYKGFPNCIASKKYYSLITFDQQSLAMVKAMDTCINISPQKGSQKVKFSDKPEVFAIVLAALGIKVSSNGIAKYAKKISTP